MREGDERVGEREGTRGGVKGFDYWYTISNKVGGCQSTQLPSRHLHHQSLRSPWFSGQVVVGSQSEPPLPLARSECMCTQRIRRSTHGLVCKLRNKHTVIILIER